MIKDLIPKYGAFTTLRKSWLYAFHANCIHKEMHFFRKTQTIEYNYNHRLVSFIQQWDKNIVSLFTPFYIWNPLTDHNCNSPETLNLKLSNSNPYSPLKSVYNMQTCTQGLICLLGIENLELKRMGDPIPKSHGYVMSMNYRMISIINLNVCKSWNYKRIKEIKGLSRF